MADIQIINPDDLLNEAPTKLNANFAALNTAKADIGAVYYFNASSPNQYFAFGIVPNSWSFGDINQTWMRLDRSYNGGYEGVWILPPNGAFAISSTGDATGTPDVGIGRAGAGLLAVTDGQTSAHLRDISVRNVLTTLTTPASSSAAGTAGTICADTDYIYVCTATNTWKRAALSTF